MVDCQPAPGATIRTEPSRSGPQRRPCSLRCTGFAMTQGQPGRKRFDVGRCSAVIRTSLRRSETHGDPPGTEVDPTRPATRRPDLRAFGRGGATGKHRPRSPFPAQSGGVAPAMRIDFQIGTSTHSPDAIRSIAAATCLTRSSLRGQDVDIRTGTDDRRAARFCW